MISTQDLYESGYVSSEHKKETHYIVFAKRIGNWLIEVTNEIEDDIVDKQYVELGMEFQKVNVSTIEELKTLEKFLTLK